MADLEFNTITDSLKDQLSTLYSSTTMSLWFNQLSIVSLDEKQAVMLAPTEFKKNILEKRYLTVIKEILGEILGFDIEIKLISAESEESLKPAAPVKEEQDEDISAYKLRFNPNYTFENFVVGKSNELAQATSLAVAKRPAELNNPLFLYGPSGLGKTHLLFAIVNEIRKNFKDFQILYVTGEEFTNELIDSLAQKKPVAFREKYRNLDVLLVDDIQFLANKLGIQEEFFHTFDTLYKQNKQIILASDCQPRDINNLEDRLKTRFEMGLVADIQPPDLELRVAIFKRKTVDMGLEIPNDVLIYLAENIKINIRQIEGSLKKLKAHSFISGEAISLEMAKSVLGDFLKSAENSDNIIEKIFNYVTKRYGLSKDALKSQKRSADIAYPRHVAIYLTRQLTSLSQKSIAKIYSRKDHTTVYNSLLVIEKKIRSDVQFEREINQIMEELRG
ncbi:MAG: chromosomal replication initiator protein DnaA [Eubacteriales bacterium]|nr:chromosomal replication initiator protein DnaA [Eubacteriales bacterium]MDD4421496.1 chromosomal replication initiator protein DnaA [Eubacteriales bacterium]